MVAWHPLVNQHKRADVLKLMFAWQRFVLYRFAHRCKNAHGRIASMGERTHQRRCNDGPVRVADASSMPENLEHINPASGLEASPAHFFSVNSSCWKTRKHCPGRRLAPLIQLSIRTPCIPEKLKFQCQIRLRPKHQNTCRIQSFQHVLAAHIGKTMLTCPIYSLCLPNVGIL